jgi:hypothetical protein
VAKEYNRYSVVKYARKVGYLVLYRRYFSFRKESRLMRMVDTSARVEN